MTESVRYKVADPRPTSYRSMVLYQASLKRQPENMPDPDIACHDCPIAIWYLDVANDLLCACPALHKPVWAKNLSAIRFCDAREGAVAEYNAALSAI